MDRDKELIQKLRDIHAELENEGCDQWALIAAEAASRLTQLSERNIRIATGIGAIRHDIGEMDTTPDLLAIYRRLEEVLMDRFPVALPEKEATDGR